MFSILGHDQTNKLFNGHDKVKYMKNLDKFIVSVNNNKCVVGIVGMGYVGLPLALEFWLFAISYG